MSEIGSLSQAFLSKIQEILVNILPLAINFLFAFAVLIIGYFISLLISKLTYRFLKKSKFDDFVDKLNLREVVGSKIDFKASKAISKILFWLVFIIFFMSASEIIGWRILTDMIDKFINLLPGIFAAIIIFCLGTYFATLVRNIIKTTMKTLGVSTGSLVANAVFFLLITLVAVTALDQAGIDTSLISNNLVMILGAFLVAGAISYGFASKSIMENILSTFFAKKNFKLGQQVKIGNIEGEIIDMTSISITLLNGTEKTIIPTKNFITENIIITKETEHYEQR